MADFMDTMGGLIGITVASGVVMNVADRLLGQPRPQQRQQTRKRQTKPVTRRIRGNTYEENLHRSVFGY